MEMPAGKLRGHDSILVVCDRFLKILHFITMIKKITAKELARLFRNNMQKFYKLPKSIISDRNLQFTARLMKKLNKMLGIEIKLLIAFYPQTNRQMEKINQNPEQYLKIYINYRQSNWSDWLITAKFIFNNKVHTIMKSLPFKINYKIESRISFEIRKKRKNVKAEKLIKKMKEIYKKVKTALKKLQKETKRYADRNRKKTVEYKVEDRILLSTKNLVWQMRNRKMKKLIKKFVRSYKIKKIISENTVELELLISMKIHLVVNLSRIVLYQKQVEEQKKIISPLVEINREKEYKVEKILNRRDVREKPKYLVRWK